MKCNVCGEESEVATKVNIVVLQEHLARKAISNDSYLDYSLKQDLALIFCLDCWRAKRPQAARDRARLYLGVTIACLALVVGMVWLYSSEHSQVGSRLADVPSLQYYGLCVGPVFLGALYGLVLYLSNRAASKADYSKKMTAQPSEVFEDFSDDAVPYLVYRMFGAAKYVLAEKYQEWKNSNKPKSDLVRPTAAVKFGTSYSAFNIVMREFADTGLSKQTISVRKSEIIKGSADGEVKIVVPAEGLDVIVIDGMVNVLVKLYSRDTEPQKADDRTKMVLSSVGEALCKLGGNRLIKKAHIQCVQLLPRFTANFEAAWKKYGVLN